jgi:hypothetical protein
MKPFYAVFPTHLMPDRYLPAYLKKEFMRSKEALKTHPSERDLRSPQDEIEMQQLRHVSKVD